MKKNSDLKKEKMKTWMKKEEMLCLCAKRFGGWTLVESFTVTTMTWLTAMEYLCHKHLPGLSSFMTYLRILDKQFRL